MKKQWITIVATMTLLVSCTPSKQSSSSSGTSSSGEASSSTTSSSSSTDTSSSAPVLGALMKQVGDAASKYNGGKTYEELATAANLGIEAISNEGNLVLLLQAALKDHMPIATGQRRYGGVYELPDKYYITSPTVKRALVWMVSYGLWGNETFDENKTLSSEEVETIIKRFYFYFGTNEKDDYFATHNHDFLFEDPSDQSKTVNDEYRERLLLDEKKTESNVMAYARSLASGDSSSAPFYKLALGYKDGTIDYDFLSDAEATTKINAILAISSLSDWSKACVSSLKEYGESDIMRFKTTSTSLDSEGNVYSLLVAIPGSTATFTSDEFSIDTITDEAKANYLSLGLSEAESKTYATAYASLQKKAHDLYVGDTLDFKTGTRYLFDGSSGKSIFDEASITIDLSNILTSGGYSAEEQKLMTTNDTRAYISYGKAIEGATSDELASASLDEYYHNAKDAIAYSKGTPRTYDELISLMGDNLAADYMTTSAWSSSSKILVDIFNGLKGVFSERLQSSSWLSDDGKKAAKEKLEAMKYTIVGSESGATTVDYASLKVASGLTLRQSLAEKARLVHRNLANLVATKAKVDKITLLLSSPFLPNAFYMLYTNSFLITMSAIFCLGTDLTGVSKETIYGKVGLVIGHEMTHGFDRMGVYLDKDGKIKADSILPKEDRDHFSVLTDKVTALYKDVEVLPGIAQNSSITTGETAADIAGFTLTESLGAKDPTFDFKKFYEETAMGLGAKVTRGNYKSNYFEDPHPFGRVRCNTLLSNSGRFETLYGLKEGDGMYIAPSKRVVIW